MRRFTISKRIILYVLVALSLILAAGQAQAAGPKITEETLKKVHAAYLEAKQNNFSIEAMVKLYGMPDVPNVAGVVKKLVDLHQSRPELAINPADSQAMEKTRQEMNMRILAELASITGGSVEVMNAGKQNGIRSDKDLMIFATLDGKKPLSATKMKELYEKNFKEIHGIDLERMDMTIFDGDAAIPDWRKMNCSFDEFKEKYKQGQALLEQNPEAVREAGTWRQGAELRYATNSRVTIVKPVLEGRDPGKSNTTDFEVRDMDMRTKKDDPEHVEKFAVIEEMHVKQASERYGAWSKDLPYRNSMDASFEWWQRYEHSNDFVDRMKYFNRTVGDGVNSLAEQGWDVQYIFHLAKMEARASKPGGPRDRTNVDAFIERMVHQVYTNDCSPDMVKHFERIIKIATYIELDKMCGQSKGEAHYLAPIMADIQKENKAKTGQELPEADALTRAREKFFEYQRQVMRYNLMLTTRNKLRMDLGDKDRIRRLKEKYSDPVTGQGGDEAVKKLTWETWRQVGRIIDQLDDEQLIKKMISDAPEELRPRMESMYELAKLKRAEAAEQAKRNPPAKSDPKKAAESGPEEKVLGEVKGSEIAERESRLQKVLDRVGAPIDQFKSDLVAGEYSEDAIKGRMRDRIMESLGYEEKVNFNKMEAEFEKSFSGKKLMGNVLSLNNANSVLNVLLVYQETGDWKQAAQTAVWEVVSNFPYVSEIATLKQSFNDGNYEGLTFLFLAYNVPGAGHVKIAFDVVKGSLTLVYNHAMEPLKDDRFSQVYMGYIDAQPAGWSPFKPGWKERRDAAGMSILHFVPGETFDEKRTNMFGYFNAKLDAKLKANGILPTTQDYWQKYDDIIEPFFGVYVTDYFNAAGDWTENTTAGLRAIGQQAELKKKLIARLAADFRAGQRNYEHQQLMRSKMEEALANMDAVAQRSVEVERKREIAIDALALSIAQGISDNAGKLAAAIQTTQTPNPKPVLKVIVSPPVVQEGQEASFEAMLINPDPSASGEAPVIEVKRKESVATNAKQGILSVDEFAAEMEIEDNIEFVKYLVEDVEAPTKRFAATSIKYEVTARTKDGRTIATEEVEVDLVGAAKHPRDENVQVKLVKITSRQGKPSGKSNDPNDLTSYYSAQMTTRTSEYIDYDSALVTPFNCTSEQQALSGWRNLGLALWVTWKDAPVKQPTYAQMKISGGAPPFTKEFGQWVSGRTAFPGDPNNEPKPGGNLFDISPEFPPCSVGSFTIEGKLLIYPKEDYDEAARKKMKPSVEFPFRAEFDISEPKCFGKGSLTIDPLGDITGGRIDLKDCQPGRRPVKVSYGGRDRFFWIEAGTDPYISFSDLRNCLPVESATLLFKNFGRLVSVTVPMEIKKGGYNPPELPRERLARMREEIAELKKDEQMYLIKISYAYDNIAGIVHEWKGKEYEPWKEAKMNRLQYLTRAIAAMANPEWKAFGVQSVQAIGPDKRMMAWPGDDRKGDRPAFAAAAVKYYSNELIRFCSDTINEAASGDDQEMVAAMVAAEEKAAAAVPGKETQNYIMSGYSALARVTFAATGDLDAAKAIYQKAAAIQAQLSGSAYVPGPTPYDIEETVR